MILLDIILQDAGKAEEISKFLIDKNLAYQTHIDNNTILTSTGKKETIRLFFITKALLYNTIEMEVKKRFFSPEMLIYATPVSHINEEFGELLREKINEYQV